MCHAGRRRLCSHSGLAVVELKGELDADRYVSGIVVSGIGRSDGRVDIEDDGQISIVLGIVCNEKRHPRVLYCCDPLGLCGTCHRNAGRLPDLMQPYQDFRRCAESVIVSVTFQKYVAAEWILSKTPKYDRKRGKF